MLQVPLRCSSVENSRETRREPEPSCCSLEELDDGLNADDMAISEEAGWVPHSRPLPPPPPDPPEEDHKSSAVDTSETEQPTSGRLHAAAVPTSKDGISSSPPVPCTQAPAARGSQDSVQSTSLASSSGRHPLPVTGAPRRPSRAGLRAVNGQQPPADSLPMTVAPMTAAPPAT